MKLKKANRKNHNKVRIIYKKKRYNIIKEEKSILKEKI